MWGVNKTLKSQFKFYHEDDVNTIYTCTPDTEGCEITWYEEGEKQSVSYLTEEVEEFLSAGVWIPVQEEGG